MILVKKLKFFNILCLSQIDQEKAFPDVSEDYRNICLWKVWGRSS